MWFSKVKEVPEWKKIDQARCPYPGCGHAIHDHNDHKLYSKSNGANEFCVTGCFKSWDERDNYMEGGLKRFKLIEVRCKCPLSKEEMCDNLGLDITIWREYIDELRQAYY